MAHDTHFLRRLQRFEAGDLDLALGLYRDPRAVRLILECNPLPADAERVALALTDEPEPPHVVVTRDGRFVTCLSPGMSVKRLPVIARHRVDAGIDSSLRVGRADARITEVGGAAALIRRLTHSGHRLAREDFETIALLAPAIQPLLTRQLMRDSKWIQGFQRSMTPRRLRQDDPAHRRDLHTYMVACDTLKHLTLLSVYGMRSELDLGLPADVAAWVPVAVLLPGDAVGVAACAAYAAAMGPELLPGYAELWQQATDPAAALAPLVAAVALCVRSPHSRSDVLRCLADETAPVFDDPGGAEQMRVLVEMVRETFARDLVAENERGIRAMLRDNYRGEQGFSDDASDAIVDGVGGLTTAQCLAPGGLRFVVPWAAWAALRAPQDLYLPAATLAGMDLRYDLEVARLGLTAWLGYYRRGAPVARQTPKVGRNDPCPCGSGRKHKRCCLKG